MTTDHLDLPEELKEPIGQVGKKVKGDDDSGLEKEVSGLRTHMENVAFAASAMLQRTEDEIHEKEEVIAERARQRVEIATRAKRMLEPVSDTSDEPDEEPEPETISVPEPEPEPLRIVVEPEAPVPPARPRPVEELPPFQATDPDDDWVGFRAPELIQWDGLDTATPRRQPRQRSVYDPRSWGRCLLPWTLAALGLFIGLIVGDHTYTLVRGDLRTGWFTLVWILAVMGFGFFLLGGIGERRCRRHHHHEER